MPWCACPLHLPDSKKHLMSWVNRFLTTGPTATRPVPIPLVRGATSSGVVLKRTVHNFGLHWWAG